MVGHVGRAGRLTVYLQPKVRMDTRRLARGEALVRGVGEDGSIIPPAQFIGLFEEDGSIRDLDFFVLEQALGAFLFLLCCLGGWEKCFE